MEKEDRQYKSLIIQKIISTKNLSIENIFNMRGRIYTFLNPVSYLDALKHKELFEQFDGIFADGALLVAAIKIVYGKTVTRRSFDMTSLAPVFFNYAEHNGRSIYIVASTQKQIEKAIGIFKERYPELLFSGYRNGYFSSEEKIDDEVAHIVTVKPDFLIVGMGALLQERFLLKIKNAGFKGIGFTCGGFIHQTSQNEIDYYSGWINRMNLRFIYRIYREKHTRKRYLQAGLLFPIRFILEKFFG